MLGQITVEGKGCRELHYSFISTYDHAIECLYSKSRERQPNLIVSHVSRLAVQDSRLTISLSG